MSALQAESRARENFARHIEANRYPGRGLIVGRSRAGDWLQLYWIMGRSPGSRNRVFTLRDGALCTEARDEGEGVGDAALTLYEAMLELPGLYLVGNGAQTRGAATALGQGERYEDALARFEHEDDAPHHTPRISGLLDFRSGAARLTLSILKASPADPGQTDRFHYHPATPPAGLGLGLTTYAGALARPGAPPVDRAEPLPEPAQPVDRAGRLTGVLRTPSHPVDRPGRLPEPLLAFEGEPLWLPLDGEPQELVARYWRALDAGNRVALALKRIPARGDGPGRLWIQNRERAAPAG